MGNQSGYHSRQLNTTMCKLIVCRRYAHKRLHWLLSRSEGSRASDPATVRGGSTTKEGSRRAVPGTPRRRRGAAPQLRRPAGAWQAGPVHPRRREAGGCPRNLDVIPLPGCREARQLSGKWDRRRSQIRCQRVASLGSGRPLYPRDVWIPEQLVRHRSRVGARVDRLDPPARPEQHSIDPGLVRGAPDQVEEVRERHFVAGELGRVFLQVTEIVVQSSLDDDRGWEERIEVLRHA